MAQSLAVGLHFTALLLLLLALLAEPRTDTAPAAGLHIIRVNCLDRSSQEVTNFLDLFPTSDAFDDDWVVHIPEEEFLCHLLIFIRGLELLLGHTTVEVLGCVVPSVKNGEVHHGQAILDHYPFNFGIVLAQKLEYAKIVVGDGIDQRRRACLVAVVDLDSTLDQKSHHLDVPIAAGVVQQGLPAVEFVDTVRVFLQDLADCLHFAIDDIGVEFIDLVLSS